MTSCLACTRIGRDCPENCLLSKHINSVEVMQTVEGHFGSLANFIRLVEAGASNREKAAQTLLHEATCRKKDPVLGVLGVAQRAGAHLKTVYLASTQPATSPLAVERPVNQGSSSNIDTVAGQFPSIDDLPGSSVTAEMDELIAAAAAEVPKNAGLEAFISAAARDPTVPIEELSRFIDITEKEVWDIINEENPNQQ